MNINNNMDFMKFYHERSAIILGGCGFIGSNLASALQDCFARITVVDDLISGTGGNRCNLDGISADFIKSNIQDVCNWGSAIEPDSVIFHCAAKNTHKWCNLHIEEDCKINYYPQLSIVKELHKLPTTIRLVYCSTRTVYKITSNTDLTEFSDIAPQDVYSIHSYASENLFRLLLPKQQVRILRLTNTYGPKQRLSGEELGLVGELIHAALNNKNYQIFHNGKAMRDINYIDDVVRGLLSIAMIDDLDYPVIHLGGNWVPTKDVVQCLSDITGWVNYEYNDSFSQTFSPLSINRAKQILGWQPLVNLKTGITNTIDYFQENKNKYEESR